MEPTFTDKITVRLIQSAGGDHMVVAAARVSTSGEEAVKFADPASAEENAGLINYLMKMRHGTPFEHASLTFFVHAPIFVWREWHRHRIGFCLSGDSVIDFVDTNGTRAPGICRTIRELHDRWEHGEISGQRTDEEQLGRAMELIGRGVSIRAAAAKTGVAQGTIKRRRTGTVEFGRRGSRWRVEGMRLRVLNEDDHLFTSGQINDVVESGIKELIGLSSERGHSLRCTRDHRILTADGWAAAGDLRKGDRIAVVGRRSKFAERRIPPSLRRGIGVWTSMQRGRLIRDEDQCHVCGSAFPRGMLILDHVIPVAADLTRALDVSNLKPICEACNRVKTDGEQALAQRANVAGSKFVRLTETPSAAAEEMTYDIAVRPPWHNFVANGIVVHNSYNEESARYKALDPVFYLPSSGRPMMKVDGWKPGRPRFLRCDDPAVYHRLRNNLERSYRVAYEAYADNLSLGVDPGLARDCLPVGIYSSCWVTCNPRSLMSFLSLRTHTPSAKFVSYPLHEMEEAARACEAMFAEGWPLTYAAFNEAGRVGP
jgi:thymidylate synthase ThyX